MIQKILTAFVIMIWFIPLVYSEEIYVLLDYRDGRFILNKTALYSTTGDNINESLSDYIYVAYSVKEEILDKDYIKIPGPTIIERDDKDMKRYRKEV